MNDKSFHTYYFQRRFDFIGVVSKYITIKESLMITGAKKLLMSILAVVIMCGFVVGCSGSGSPGNPSGSSDTVVPVNSGTGSLSGSGK